MYLAPESVARIEGPLDPNKDPLNDSAVFLQCALAILEPGGLHRITLRACDVNVVDRALLYYHNVIQDCALIDGFVC